MNINTLINFIEILMTIHCIIIDLTHSRVHWSNPHTGLIQVTCGPLRSLVVFIVISHPVLLLVLGLVPSSDLVL